jgi:hypothetical protein
MARFYDKRPREHRKRMHYNTKGVEKQSFESEECAEGYIKRKRMSGYVAYLCVVCSRWHIGRAS